MKNTKQIVRSLTYETVETNDPALEVVYCKWADATGLAFMWAIRKVIDIPKVWEKALEPSAFGIGKQKFSFAKSRNQNFYYYNIFLADKVVEKYRKTGDRDFDRASSWIPTKYGERPPDGYSVYQYCSYNNTMADSNGKIIVAPRTFLLCATSYDMSKVAEVLKNRDDVTILFDDYVRGNGRSMTIAVDIDEKTALEIFEAESSTLYGTKYYIENDLLKKIGVAQYKIDGSWVDDDEDDD